MVTDNYINENKTETFKKGDKVIMHSCHEATFEEYKDRVWICATPSFLDKGLQDVVFLEDFSGYFLTKYLKICNSTGMSFVLLNQKLMNQHPDLINVIDFGGSYKTAMKILKDVEIKTKHFIYKNSHGEDLFLSSCGL